MVSFFLCLFLLVSTVTVGIIGARVLLSTLLDVSRLPPEFWKD